MRTQQTSAVGARPLDVLGISKMEEQAYQCLLAHPRSTARELSRILGWSQRKTGRLLNSIEAKGLVTHFPERSPKYIPVSPTIAMEAIVLQHQRRLDDARSRIQELQRDLVAGQQEEPEQMIELLTGPAAERQTYLQVLRTAQHDVCVLTRPPLRISNLLAPHDVEVQIQDEARAKGVRYRTIVDASMLALPGCVERIRHDIESGEEYRLFSHLPFKMMLADSRTAMFPLNVNEIESPWLLVRSSALLDALRVLFEILWDRSAAVSFDHHRQMTTGATNPRWTQELDEVLSLLALGLNDKAITLKLNISMRTLARRIVELMENLDAHTRFQAGWLAARRFSVEQPTAPETGIRESAG